MREKRNDQGKQKQDRDPTFLLQSRGLKWKAGRSFELLRLAWPVAERWHAAATTLLVNTMPPASCMKRRSGLSCIARSLGFFFDFGAEVAGVGAVIHLGMCSHFVGAGEQVAERPLRWGAVCAAFMFLANSHALR